MSLDNFIPQLWSASVFTALRKNQVYASVMSRDFEGDVSAYGDRVKLTTVGAVTVNDYTKGATLTYQTADAAAQWIDINKAKYFAVNVDDIDSAQANVDLMQAITAEAGYALSDSQDQVIAALYSDATTASDLGTSASPLSVSSDGNTSTTSVLDHLSRMSTCLSDNGAPVDGRFIVVPPWYQGKLSLAKLGKENTTNDALTNGFIGKIMGFNVYVSQNVSNTSSAKYKILAGVPSAWQIAEQVVKTESLRRETTLGEAVRGLHLYGCKVTRPKALIVSTCSTYAG